MLPVIFAIGSFQSFIFSLLLFTKKEKKKADQYLAIFFFIIMLYFLNFYSYSFNLWKIFPDILFITTLIPLFIGPSLYFYVCSITRQETSRREKLYHLIPILLIYLIILPFLFKSDAEKSLYFTEKFKNLSINISIGTFLQYLSAPVYFTWIIANLSQYKKDLKDNYSNLNQNTIDWMQKLLFGAISFWMINCLDIYILNFTDINIEYTLSQYAKIPFLIFIILIGIIGIKMGGVFTALPTNISLSQEEDHHASVQEEVEIIDVSNKLHLPIQVLSYMSDLKVVVRKNDSNKLDAQTQKHLQSLLDFMHEEKMYLNSELRIQDIAIKLDLSTHYLSKLINTHLNQNFYDFVNQFRVEEAKKCLLDQKCKNLTVLAIALDCGFNSKATFNRLFKKHTGYTPTQFMKKECD